MKQILKICAYGTILSLLFQCSCATANKDSAIVPAKDLPTELAINDGAGHGDWLFISLRLEEGEALPFIVDTGASGTVLDKSLEPELGKCLGVEQRKGWTSKGRANVYVAPKLYLGDTQLMTGGKVWTADLNHPSGILGMDCLKHYCIQLDFSRREMRFLTPDQVTTTALGKAYPLTLHGNLPFVHHAGLIPNSTTNLLIDTGCRPDGVEGRNTINGSEESMPVCVWDGQTYSNVTVHAVEDGNALGLKFLARHLVTLDFPNRTLYLKSEKD